MKKLIIYLAMVLFTGTACSVKLTREDALKKIKENSEFPVVKTYEIIKSYVKDMDTQGRGVSIVIGEDENVEKEKTLRLFQHIGLLQLTETPQRSESTSFLLGTTIRTWTLVEVRLTDSGKKYLVGEDSNNYSVKLWETDIDEITGIMEAKEEKTAAADYTLVNKNITPFGEFFSDKSNTDGRTAYFILYDDGWRIQH
jgi:hypothetical protein